MRSLMQFLARTDPEIFALCEIDAGDALAVATRFVRQYAYRGGQAVFLRNSVDITAVRDDYVPLWPGRPFDRRGVVWVQARYGSRRVSVLTAKLASGREQRAAEIRHVRTIVRALERPAVVLIHCSRDAALHFPRYQAVAYPRPVSERVYQAGFGIHDATVDDTPHHGIGTPVRVTLFPER